MEAVQPPREVEVAVIGGGQAGLATAFYLRRAGLEPGHNVVVVDAADEPGGAWPRTWDGLRLFSPSSYSSLPGWMMPAWSDGYPPRDHVVEYLARYEDRYDLRVARPHRVRAVTRADQDPAGRLLVHADGLVLAARAVVSATGTWAQPWADGTEQPADAIIWCTGFRPALRHLRELGLPHIHGHPVTGGPAGRQATGEPRLSLVGYGDWTGPASATLVGVGRSARDTAHQIAARLSS